MKATPFASILIVGSLLASGNSSAIGYEQSVQCTGGVAPDPAKGEFYAPSEVQAEFTQDSQSKLAGMFVSFIKEGIKDVDGNPLTRFTGPWLKKNGLGFEFKVHFYNYDDAAATGKGPAFALGQSGYFWCAPASACYLDSDFLSEKNSNYEYREPMIGIGMWPGAIGELTTFVPGGSGSGHLAAIMRLTSGRGNRSLMKVRYVVTKAVSPVAGVSGMFGCKDTPPIVMIPFSAGAYAPTCVRWTASSDAVHGSASSCVP